MSKINLENKTNTELMKYQHELKQDFDVVKKEVIFKYLHLTNIEKEYKRVLDELNIRYGIKT